jgi:uncharacterized protein YjeT (DUF2065 family)
MEMTQTIIAWASAVNAISVLVLVVVTIFYAREASKSRKAAERQAETSEETLRMLRLQIEEQAGLGRTIVKTAMQSALRAIEYWQQENNVYNLATLHQLPSDINLVPEGARSAVEHARRISVEGSEQLSSSFDSLRFAETEITIMRDAKQTDVRFYEARASNANRHLTEAKCALEQAQRLFRQSG